MLKNPEILKMVEEQKTFEVLFIQETTQGANRAIIRIDPEILNHLNNLKHIRRTNAVIYVPNTACRFFNLFHIVQCYQCQSFRHKMSQHYVRSVQQNATYVCIATISPKSAR